MERNPFSQMWTIKLKTSNGEVINADIGIVTGSQYMKTILADNYKVTAHTIIPLPIESEILQMVIRWTTYHRCNSISTKDYDLQTAMKISAWNAAFFHVPLSTLLKLGEAAGFLKIRDLLMMVSEAIAMNESLGTTVERVFEYFWTEFKLGQVMSNSRKRKHRDSD